MKRFQTIRSHPLVMGTFILTFTGIISRIMGFFYRIYLSRLLGAAMLGVYQLVFPIYGVCFTLYGAGIQTALSQMIASTSGLPEQQAKKREKQLLCLSLGCSLMISLSLSFLLRKYAPFIAGQIIQETACTRSLYLLSFLFPFCGVAAVINGYYYGRSKTFVPATTQLVEQFVRVSLVLILSSIFGASQKDQALEYAILGLIAGEISSCLYNISSLILTKKHLQTWRTCQKQSTQLPRSSNLLLFPFLKIAVPLSTTKLLVTLLQSAESILIPLMLRKYGFNTEEALTIYGILFGMVMPFILFPSTITNSLSVMLIPSISKDSSAGNSNRIHKTSKMSIKSSIIIGFIATGESQFGYSYL